MIYLLTIGGIVVLMLAGDALVRGAIGLSLRLGLSVTLISLTVVAFGTSAPELVISIEAALKGSTDIALGNVVGSNIANSWLIVGVPALLLPMATRDPDEKPIRTTCSNPSFSITVATSAPYPFIVKSWRLLPDSPNPGRSILTTS